MPTRAGAPPGVEARAGRFPGPSLMPALTAIQRRHGWLPREELVALSRDVRRPLYEIEGVISFYPHFRTTAPAKKTVHVCRDLTCWLNGAAEKIAAAHAEAGEDVEVVEVSCLGRCDVAPAAAIDEVPERLGAQGERDEPWPNDPYATGEDRYRVLRAAIAGDIAPEAIVQVLKDSGLRGMGGAGFPTGTKWDLVAQQPGPIKFAICNADESEPGTFKDREILRTQPHLVLEGLMLGMLVTGAEEGWIFIRHEYGPEEEILREEIERLRADGLVGEGRTVEIFTSPGGYILGEETALLECMEGHRGEPRNKPPFPVGYGLWGKPTLMNSVETFAHVPVIVERGADWWKDQGAGDSTGLKFFAVSGHVERPGVYCVPMGTPGRELLALAGGVSGGRGVGAIQPGGASSNFMGPEGLDVPLDFATIAEAGSMLGSGAVVIMAEGTDPLAAATNVLRFFRDESCGKCVPCRLGSTKAHSLLTDLLERGGGVDDVPDEVVQLEETMRLTSICGLGQVALGPVISVLGMARGGAEAREQPRDDDGEAPSREG